MLKVRWWVGLLCCCPLLVSAAPVHFGSDISTPDASAFARARAAGMTVVRLDATWPRLQPRATQWDFSWLDRQVAAAKAQGLDVVLVLGPSPRWAVSYLQNPSAAEVARAKPDLPAYRTYVTAVVKHYQHRVQAYQLWARPTGTTLLAMPKDVQAIFRTGAAAAHSVNPAITVIAPEPGDIDLSWIADYLKSATGPARPDVLSLGPLRTVSTPDDLWWRVQMLRLRVLSAPAPSLQIDIPVVSPPSWSLLAAAALLQNIAQVTFTAGSDGADPLANTGAAALCRTLSALEGYTYTGWTSLTAAAPAGVFTRQANTLLLLLPQAEVAVTVPAASVPSGVIQCHPLAASAQPVAAGSAFACAPSLGPVLLAGVQVHATAGTPPTRVLPVKEQSVALDPTAMNPAAIRPRRDLPGGKYLAYPMEGRQVLSTQRDTAPWIHLDVPDGFIFYNTARIPIEVTVRVYGVSTREKTGFNLYYDAAGGMNTTPWQWIDVGPGAIYSYTTRLNDAVFADREGYDLRINMGGSTESVRVVDVAIRKLRLP